MGKTYPCTCVFTCCALVLIGACLGCPWVAKGPVDRPPLPPPLPSSSDTYSLSRAQAANGNRSMCLPNAGCSIDALLSGLGAHTATTILLLLIDVFKSRD